MEHKTIRTYRGDTTVTRLSYVLWLSDSVVGKGPVRGYRVRIPSAQVTAKRNASGFHCFMDLPDGTYEARIESVDLHGRGRYLPETLTVTTPSHQPHVVPLMPSTTYPFPAGATLARGRVTQTASAIALKGAEISVIGSPALRSRSAAGGHYAIYFAPASSGAAAILRVERDGLVRQVPVSVPAGETRTIPDISLG